MNLLSYFRQAWRMMMANRLFSLIYISGTALAIATTTIFAIIYYVKIAPIYPETNRGDTYYIRTAQMSYRANDGYSQSPIGDRFYREQLRDIDGVYLATAVVRTWDDSYLRLPSGDEMKVEAKRTDPEFFRIYPYRFLAGRPISKEEFDSGTPVAVVGSRTARRLYGVDDPLGKPVTLDFIDFRIIGVVEEGSSLMQNSYADIIVPYTTDRSALTDQREVQGPLNVVYLSKEPEKLKAAIEGIVQRHNAADTIFELSFLDYPKPHILDSLFRYDIIEEGTVEALLKQNAIVLLVLLLVPALNLSGLISSRMEARSAETGVMRSFGATRSRLLGQVLWENLFLTLFGGVVGLGIVWLSLWLTDGRLLTLLDRYAGDSAGGGITSDILFAPAVFVAALALCVILNLLSALLPAWKSLRRPIVNTLK